MSVNYKNGGNAPDQGLQGLVDRMGEVIFQTTCHVVQVDKAGLWTPWESCRPLCVERIGIRVVNGFLAYMPYTREIHSLHAVQIIRTLLFEAHGIGCLKSFSVEPRPRVR